MRAYNAHQFIPFKWSGRNWARRMGWSREELDLELARFYAHIFMRNVERQGKQRWGDKTPFHTWHIDAMARLFPDSVFVGIIRHPGANVSSNMNRFGHSFARSVDHVLRYDRELARQATRYQDRFALVRYEDLVLRSEPVLRELLDWLDEPWSDGVLAHHTVQVSRGGNLTVEGQNRVDDPIDVSRVTKWHWTMAEKHRPKLAQIVGPIGEFWGYAIDDPAGLEPLRSDGGLLIRGADVAARAARFPDLELETEPETPIGDRFFRPAEIQLRYKDQSDPKPPAPPPSALRRAWRRLPAGAQRRIRRLARRPAARV
jgi:sulfotransferase family protein